MTHIQDCIFCGIAQGTMPCHRVWEDDKHLAFLSIFPNTEGFTVVIPKEHQDSYVAAVPEEVADGIFRAARIVARKIDAAFPDVGRTGFMFEGFGVNHLHAKLFPMHGTSDESWRQHKSHERRFFPVYEGFMSSHDSERADDAALATIAEKIRNA
ncbi:MAG: HIT family protein [Candidatus Pacebacteria bacterium]|nr:HIT family protein [Candidatus Paceibacterota bacterium]